MIFSPKAIWDFLKEITNSHPLISSAVLWSLPATLLWPLLIPLFISDYRIGDHLHYLLYKDPQFKQKELGESLNRINKLIDEQEYYSFENYQHLNDAISYKYKQYKQNEENNLSFSCPFSDKSDRPLDECYPIVLRANSNTHEFIRSFLQVNDAYFRLLKISSDDGSVHRFIDNFYTSSNRLLKPLPLCEDVIPSYSTLRSLHNRIDIIDDSEVRDRLNLEVLRLLTFSAAFLETNCKNTTDEKAYLVAMDIYNRRASDIVNRTFKNPSNSLYLRKIYWLDLSQRIAEEKKGKSRNWKLYKEVSDRLNNKLPPEFYKAKLSQNRNVTRTVVDSNKDK
jgi:hypothetical protein